MKHTKEKYQKQIALIDEKDWFVKICAIEEFKSLLKDEMKEIVKQLNLKDKKIDPEKDKQIMLEIKKLAEPIVPFANQAAEKIYNIYTQAKNQELRIFAINAMGVIGGTRALELLKKIWQAQIHTEEVLLQITLAIGGISAGEMFRMSFLEGEEYYIYLVKELKKKKWEKDLAKILIHFGQMHGKNQAHEQAKKFFEKAVEVHPEDYYNWIFLGQAHELMNELMEAEKYYQKALEVNAKSEHAWYSLGIIHYKQKEIQQALECFKKAVDCNLKDEINQYNVGLMYFLLEDYKNAEKTWKYVLYLNPNHKEAKLQLKRIKERNYKK
ncbi:MAG: tetratricopeptide repeat protein [Candidatus Heimdallarchaeota archaeon]|nr:tetratricopeptide repeat protein [Candidatus Heimdallarchaeota archaeon]